MSPIGILLPNQLIDRGRSVITGSGTKAKDQFRQLMVELRMCPSKRRHTMRTTSCQTQDSVRVSLGVRPVQRLNDAVKLAWLEKPSRKASSDSLTSSLSR